MTRVKKPQAPNLAVDFLNRQKKKKNHGAKQLLSSNLHSLSLFLSFFFYALGLLFSVDENLI